jgi:predicted dehydrogenase
MKDASTGRPRLGFLGLGWIGRHRLEALAGSGAEIAFLADSAVEAVEAARAVAPGAAGGSTLDDVLAVRPDGVVIATPSALHAAQAVASLEAGAAVFCQKPVGRNAMEAAAVVDAAKRADRLLAADLSYRHTAAAEALRQVLHDGRLGTPRILDLTFHNAYGPDKAWFRDRRLSGGGCLIDLGVHLVDLALWLLDWPEVRCTGAQLFAGGTRVSGDDAAVEDFAAATLESEDGTLIRLACSWNLPAGQDAVIRAEVFGTGGGAAMTNVDGSFYDFEAAFLDGCRREVLAMPPDDWGGRAAVDWLRRLEAGGRFDPDCRRLVTLAETLDSVYARA